MLAAVRSKVLPEADVVMMNPAHPDAARVPPLVTRPFSFAECLHPADGGPLQVRGLRDAAGLVVPQPLESPTSYSREQVEAAATRTGGARLRAAYGPGRTDVPTPILVVDSSKIRAGSSKR